MGGWSRRGAGEVTADQIGFIHGNDHPRYCISTTRVGFNFMYEGIAMPTEAPM